MAESSQKEGTDDNSALNSQIETLELKIAQLEGIQSAMPDPYYVRDMDYNIVIWPESIAELTGYSESEAKKLKCYDIFKAAVCPPKAECPTQNCIKVKKFLKDAAVDVYHKSGSTIHTLVSNAGVYDKSGIPVGAVEIVKDNTFIKNTIDSIGLSIKDVESASENLIKVIDQVNTVSDKVKDNTNETLDSVTTGVQAGNSVNEKTEDGTKYAGNVKSGMEMIEKSMKFSMEKISDLKKNTDLINQFVMVIKDISSKTNLLAINASIEAAHAGEAGRGFKVVADGIRELSKNSSESAQSIQNTTKEITALVNAATSSLNVTEKDIETGTNNIYELITFFNDIGKAVKVLMDIMDNIDKAAAASSELVKEQHTSIVEMQKVSHDLLAIANKLSKEAYEIIQHTNM